LIPCGGTGEDVRLSAFISYTHPRLTLCESVNHAALEVMSIVEEHPRYMPGTLMVFIDETGHEEYADPSYPVFGRDGCMVMGSEYNNRIVRPWKKLLQEIDWGNTPFHTSEFVQRLRSLDKATCDSRIASINQLARHGFYRFGVTTNSKFEFPSEIDGHAVVSGGLGNFLRRVVASCNLLSVAVIFEDSERTNKFVERDFVLDNLGMYDLFGHEVSVDGYFCKKRLRIPGLELADLVAHTAGDNQRHALRGKGGVPLSFKELFRRAAGIGKAHYLRVDSVVRNAPQSDDVDRSEVAGFSS
jgi:hypothetical protein